MHIDLTLVMAAVIVVAVAATLGARGRWSGPWWLVFIGTVLAYPFSHPLLDRVEGAPDGWLRWAFQVACGMLAAVLIAPLWHRLRPADPTAPGENERTDATRPVS